MLILFFFIMSGSSSICCCNKSGERGVSRFIDIASSVSLLVQRCSKVCQVRAPVLDNCTESDKPVLDNRYLLPETQNSHTVSVFY